MFAAKTASFFGVEQHEMFWTTAMQRERESIFFDIINRILGKNINKKTQKTNNQTKLRA